MKAFVTGGTGLLGSNLVLALLSRRHEVRCLVRDTEKARRIFGDLPIEFVQGDMRDTDAFSEALKGSNVLFHAAAYFREYYQPGRNTDDLRLINVEGTVKLFEHAERRGVERIVYVSSSGVIGTKPEGEAGDEDTPPGKAVNWNRYFRSKLEAQTAIADFQRRHSIDIVQILPGWMFGPGDRGPTGSGLLVLSYLRREIHALIDGGSNVVDARDVADAMISAAERGRAGQKYLVGGRYVTFKDIMDDLEQVTGIPGPRFRIPFALALLFSVISFKYGLLLQKTVFITPESVRIIHARLRVDSSRAENELGAGFRPFVQTLRDEVEWVRGNGILEKTS